ncbi:amidase domain-containing protein [Bacillus sp. FJAT-49705]|uniref:Amidase domain-containing protein n=1 Tax=Cytobacillus citreus TaxID=2833586 RepID=A0ABS5NMA1_9BACI|nr:amidase domain-containing protein [Cytobacillus citreus]MBS4188949.1 amidase domain-containing protein [Cytobacillus citreus]
MRKVLVFLFSILLYSTFSVGQVSANEVVSKLENEYTIGEIQEILFDYFQENDINYELGSSEFLEYLISVLIEDKDEELAKHPKYDLILFYASEYVHEVEKQQSELIASEEEIKEIDLSQLQNKSVGDIKKEIASEEMLVEKEIQDYKAAHPHVYQLESTYNRTAAVNYAVEWYNKRNSQYNRHTLDCTNFVSQAVFAGGKSMTKPTVRPGGILETTSYWYSERYSLPAYNYGYRESTSWIRVVDFYSYWSRTQATVVSSSKTSIINNANLGDVVQLKRSSDGRWFHSMIVTKKANGTIYLSGHTNDTLNKSINNITADSFRVIKF